MYKTARISLKNKIDNEYSVSDIKLLFRFITSNTKMGMEYYKLGPDVVFQLDIEEIPDDRFRLIKEYIENIMKLPL